MRREDRRPQARADPVVAAALHVVLDAAAHQREDLPVLGGDGELRSLEVEQLRNLCFFIYPMPNGSFAQVQSRRAARRQRKTSHNQAGGGAGGGGEDGARKISQQPTATKWAGGACVRESLDTICKGDLSLRGGQLLPQTDKEECTPASSNR